MADNEDRSGCYLSLRAPLETWPFALAIRVSLTSTSDITTCRPDIKPNTNALAQLIVDCGELDSSQEVIRQTRAFLGAKLCSSSGCVYEGMKYS